MCMCAGKGSTAAGNWGDYQCDVPYRTLESLMEFIAGMSDEVLYIMNHFYNLYNVCRARAEKLGALDSKMCL